MSNTVNNSYIIINNTINKGNNKLGKKSDRKNGTYFVEQFQGSLKCSIFTLRKPIGRSVYFGRQMWAQLTIDAENTGLADYVGLMKMEWRWSGPWVADGVDDVEDAGGEGGGEGLRNELSGGRPREHLDLACGNSDGVAEPCMGMGYKGVG